MTVEGEVETEDRHGIVRGTCERIPDGALSARDAADRGRCRAEGIRARRDRRKPATTDWSCCIACWSASTPRSSSTPRRPIRRRRRPSLQDQTRRLPGPDSHLPRLRAAPRRAGALCRRLHAAQRRRDAAGGRPRLGRGRRQRAGLGRLRSGQRHLSDRGPRAGGRGLDYLGAAPIRGTRQGGADEQMRVAVQINQARSQWQS